MRGARRLPHCREDACAEAADKLRVARSRTGERATLFTHVVDCRPGTETPGAVCSGVRPENPICTLALLPGSATGEGSSSCGGLIREASRALGAPTYHPDDWESACTGSAPDGAARCAPQPLRLRGPAGSRSAAPATGSPAAVTRGTVEPAEFDRITPPRRDRPGRARAARRRRSRARLRRHPRRGKSGSGSIPSTRAPTKSRGSARGAKPRPAHPVVPGRDRGQDRQRDPGGDELGDPLAHRRRRPLDFPRRGCRVVRGRGSKGTEVADEPPTQRSPHAAGCRSSPSGQARPRFRPVHRRVEGRRQRAGAARDQPRKRARRSSQHYMHALNGYASQAVRRGAGGGRWATE